ncbi:MAG: DoxX family protein [Bacteroidia bacterium]
MSTIDKIEHWADTHHPIWIDFLRIILGVMLFVKGIMFARDQEVLLGILSGNSALAYMSFFVAHYVIMAHLFGGLLIVLGLLTRWGVTFQLPVLLGAVIFFNLPQGIYYAELWQALIALVISVVILIYGSGRFSVDHYMKKHPQV